MLACVTEAMIFLNDPGVWIVYAACYPVFAVY